MELKSIIEECAKRKIQLWIENGKLHFRSPVGVFDEKLKQNIKVNKDAIIEYLNRKERKKIQSSEDQKYKPFPLTDIQTAYLLGRNQGYLYGGIGCKVYAEFLTEFTDEIIFRDAVKKLIERHEMLRVQFSKEGEQRFLPYIFNAPVQIYDIRGWEKEKIKHKILAKREEMQFKQYDPEKDILFDLCLFIHDNASILCLSLDMLIGDFVSIDLIISDLEKLYNNQKMEKLTLNFRDYIIYNQNQKEDINFLIKYYEDEKYWLNKVDVFPGKPELYTREEPEIIRKGTFICKEYTVDPKKWQYLVSKCEKLNFTPTALLLYLYCATLNNWSRNSQFTVNITTLQRPSIHEDIQRIVGDFTTTSLFEFDGTFEGKVNAQVEKVQSNLFENLAHDSFTGIAVLRELKRKGKENLFPYVFTSTIGGESEDSILSKRQLLYKISETPQVIIDCQISKQINGILINWDIRDGVFPKGLIDEMFASFIQLINKSISDEDFFEKNLEVGISDRTKEIRARVNDTNTPFDEKSLVDGFFTRCRNTPYNTALIYQKEKYSYSDLLKYVSAIQQRLIEKNVEEEDKIGILLEKGVWQVASVVAVMSVGAVYVPIDITQPAERIQQIMIQANIKLNICDEQTCWKDEKSILLNAEMLNNVWDIKYKYIDPQSTAYCIFTSGSTGIPKGVEMSHAAAMNTIMDMCKKFNISEKDRIFGISNLYFDLSVFDIFATFFVGATLILPSETEKEKVSFWFKLCQEHGVTVLNLVPAQMEMYMAYLQTTEYKLDTLRLILLSGDWIPVKLVEKIHQKMPNVQCISLGGATEGGIWSIYYPTDRVKSTDKNIPYGIPLSNQRFYILNEKNLPCLDYVIGEICIAGKSLAKGYMNDVTLSDQKFQFITEIEERVYKTGDLGLYREDGVIEFVGRKDTQVKINGYRVELGEIENALKRYPGIENAVVVKSNEGSLTAYILGNKGKQEKKVIEKKIIDEEKEFKFQFTRKEFQEWIEKADKTALMYILRFLVNEKVFEDVEKRYSFEQIKGILNVIPKYEQLLMRWLMALKENKYLHLDKEGFYIEEIYSTNIAEKAEEEWKLVDKKIQYSDVLMEYIHESSMHLKELITGVMHPNELLFPQGNFDIAYAAYKDNIVNRSINRILHNEVLEIIKQQKKKKIRILEVGAGVGGSSIELLSKIQSCNVEYYFTDISNFFFNKAKVIFSQYNDWIRYKIYDINKSNWEQGFENEKFDIILCGNVLHNAVDIKKSLNNLKEMLHNEGSLFIIEEVRKRYALMTSVEFEFAEAAVKYEDGRKISESIFINFDEWQRIIKTMEGNIFMSYPEKNDILYPAGQVLMGIQFSSESELNIREIKEYLKGKIPTYMIPNRIVQLRELPMTNNGKIDRKKLYLQKNNSNQTEKKEECIDDLEKRIERIWCEVIGCQNIGRNDDFYSIGGDSLLIAQAISKMIQNLPEAKNWKWDALMMEMMKNATIRGIAEKLQNNFVTKSEKKENVPEISPFITFKDAEGDCKKARVLFHAGTGTLSSYKELLPYLANISAPCDLLCGFNFGSFDKYLERDTDSLIIETAKVYADILEEHPAEEYILIGYCVGGWLALETARILVEKGKNVSRVITISSSLCGHNYDNELLLERAFGLSIGADIEKAGYLGSNDLLQKALETYKEENGDKGISIGDLCALHGEYEILGMSFRKLNKLSQEERLKKIYENVSGDEKIDADNVSMFKMLFLLFRHSFKGIMHYEPSVYVGDVQAMFVEDDTKHFFPVRNITNKSLWENIVLGQLTVDYIPGEHISCLKEPYVREVAKLIK